MVCDCPNCKARAEREFFGIIAASYGWFELETMYPGRGMRAAVVIRQAAAGITEEES
jgi:hypothetical protein